MAPPSIQVPRPKRRGHFWLLPFPRLLQERSADDSLVDQILFSWNTHNPFAYMSSATKGQNRVAGPYGPWSYNIYHMALYRRSLRNSMPRLPIKSCWCSWILLNPLLPLSSLVSHSGPSCQYPYQTSALALRGLPLPTRASRILSLHVHKGTVKNLLWDLVPSLLHWHWSSHWKWNLNSSSRSAVQRPSPRPSFTFHQPPWPLFYFFFFF